jgi:hypothetical protein
LVIGHLILGTRHSALRTQRLALALGIWHPALSKLSAIVLLAVFVSLALVLAAPFIGEARRWIAAHLPGQYVWIVNGVVGAAGVAVAIAAVVRIRERRVMRFSLIGLAAAVAVIFSRMTGSAVPAVAAVEHFHFVQYGFITWLFYRAWRQRGDVASLVLPVVAAFIFGIGEEWWQWFLPARVGELQDVLLNTVAILCGLLVSVALFPSPSPTASQSPDSRRGVRDAVLGVAIAVAALAAFTWTVHVGYAIDDPAIGQFRSRYSASDLLALSAERTARWAANPPLVRVTLGREDQYRSRSQRVRSM